MTLLGQEFQVSDLHPKRNSIDDSTVWISLPVAQRMLGLENLIHAIMALECNCSVVDRVGQIRAEIIGLLPGTRVEQLSSKALARAEARTEAKQAAERALENQITAGNRQLEQEKSRRATFAKQRELLAAVLVPLVLLGAAFWIGMLTLGNVRGRTMEIGILRAIGFRSKQIVGLFLAKALLIGLLGAILGYGVVVVVADLWGEAPEASTAGFSLGLLGVSLGLATLLSGLASWIPALLAAGQEPADVLREG
jgi:predicted lysophospholipase L1 biosynthesis ABC-type transport system permease subunit